MNQNEWIVNKTNELQQTLIKKNTDYGDAFAKRFQKHGILSAFIRMEDKWLRLENLIANKNNNLVDESIEDTVKDLIGYGLLTLIELEKEKQNEK